MHFSKGQHTTNSSECIMHITAYKTKYLSYNMECRVLENNLNN